MSTGHMLQPIAFYFNIPLAEPMILGRPAMKKRTEGREAQIDEMLRTPARNSRYGGASLGEIIRKAVRPEKRDTLTLPKKPRTPAGA